MKLHAELYELNAPKQHILGCADSRPSHKIIHFLELKPVVVDFTWQTACMRYVICGKYKGTGMW